MPLHCHKCLVVCLCVQLNGEISSASRSGKQCRTRWLNHLDPAIKKEPWTEAEERVIYQVKRACHL
jgi:hypothetical protein